VKRTIIVVPCFNEAERLRVNCFQNFAAANRSVRFLFVNDGSTDGTGQLLDSIRLVAPVSFGVLHLTRNSGKAEAVRAGVLAALDEGCDYVGYWDADLATPIRAISSFLAVLEEKPEIELVLGSRVRLLGRRIERRTARHYLGRVFATAASLSLDLAIYDTQCGAKLFRSSPALGDAFSLRFHSRWVFDVELLARLIVSNRSGTFPRLERSVYELPLVEWEDVEGSKIRPRDFVRAAMDLLLIHRRYRAKGRVTDTPSRRPIGSAEGYVGADSNAGRGDSRAGMADPIGSAPLEPS
jgi:dolichyl-phosphate beta-glucosyltransferase